MRWFWQKHPDQERVQFSPAAAEPPQGPLPSMPNPTGADLADPQFKAIWSTIKSWDIADATHYGGYCSANGSHVMLILNALRELKK